MLDENANFARGNSDFNSSAENFGHAVRTLMFGYALVSAADATGHEWCNIEAAMSHIAAVEYMSRLNSKCAYALHSRILEIEMTIRTEWGRVCQHEPAFSLTDAVALTAQRRLWPCVSEFKPVKGKGKGGKQDRQNMSVNRFQGRGVNFSGMDVVGKGWWAA